jgi:hypothetical protein
MSTEHLASYFEESKAVPRRNHNPNETYARYERSPFRNYSLRPNQGVQDDSPVRQSSIMDRINSVRARFGDSRRKGRGSQKSKRNGSERPRPDYSLAGPSQQDDDDEYDSYDSDEGFGEYGRRPQPQIGLAKPFPRQKRGGRWKQSKDKMKKPKQAKKGSRTEPGSESGKPEGQVRG